VWTVAIHLHSAVTSEASQVVLLLGAAAPRYCIIQGDTRWRCWRHCATSVKVAGSIPNGGIFHWHNPSSRTMPLGSTGHRREMSTRNISGAWINNLAMCRLSWNFEGFNLLEPLGPVEACKGIDLPLPLHVIQLLVIVFSNPIFTSSLLRPNIFLGTRDVCMYVSIFIASILLKLSLFYIRVVYTTY
jgi:hypothetical protein